MNNVTAVNPILNGFYPDPSICAVGEDFYLVNSTFAYFPGVPIFHSRDLAHWKQIGNILDRNTQIPLSGCGHSRGIYAPTIRYHKGTFYMITTNVSGGGNFVVTAERPEGPWSEPYFLGEEEAPGIDPSLFFDEDGKCYYVGTRPNPEGVRYNGDWEIWVQELNLEDMKLCGESTKLWKGALQGVIWPEGPHLYKKDGYYYLMIAEGGTGPDHSITVARSRVITGPYENNPDNPILTHRHLGTDYPITYVGHGDLVQDCQGNWYVVMLASRPCEGYTNMGRETFLAKVRWENDWPIVNPGVGKLEEHVDIPLKPYLPVPKNPIYDFHRKRLDSAFVMLRNPKEGIYSLEENKGRLRLYLQPETLKEEATPAYVAVRQQHSNYQAGAMLSFTAGGETECAGLAVLQNNHYHVRFEKYGIEGKSRLRVIVCEAGEDRNISDCEVPEGEILLKIVNRGQKADFCYCVGDAEVIAVSAVDMHCLSTEVAGGFTGCTIGMYASSGGKEGKNYADYEWFFYQGQ